MTTSHPISQTARPTAFIMALLTASLSINAYALEVIDGKQSQSDVRTQQSDTPDKLATDPAILDNKDSSDNSNSGDNGDNNPDKPSQDEQTDKQTDKQVAKEQKPICSPDALAVGIAHFSYDEAFAEDLVWSGYGDKKQENKLIHKDVKEPLQTLVKAAAKDKVALYPSSIFRSVKAQDTIVKRKIRQKQPAKTIYYTSSPPGYSEHHTGYAVDFAPIDERFAKTKGYKWLMENAEKYGWEKTFTPEFSAKTGVSEESWHWRYVGDEHGKTIFAPRTCQPYGDDSDTNPEQNTAEPNTDTPEPPPAKQ